MGVHVSPWEGAILRDEGAAHCEVWGLSAVRCAKMPELIEMMLFGLSTREPCNHVLDEVHTGAT